MEYKVLALGITAIVISGLIFATALILISTVQPKDNNLNDDQEIISEKFLYYHGINISWLGEATFRIRSGDLVVFIDPYQVSSNEEKADIIISTHSHGEHLSLVDVRKLSDANTSFYTPEPDLSIDGIGPTSRELLIATPANVSFVKPGMVVSQSGVILEFVPAYNLNKYNYFIPGQLWHPPWANWTGVIVEIDNIRIYHPGDTDHIPEMKQINCDIFLAPVGGVGVMSPIEAAEAVEFLKINSDLKYAIPMHYPYLGISSLIMRSEDFAARANCTVVILKPLYMN
ncbi:MAG: MBL fold metallo-hydrolase [Candidatus Hodarchaeota archaeon]